jgi:hypothetical protein
VLFFEHKHLYRRIKGEVPDERYTTPFGKARVHRQGDDVTVITWGAMVYTATRPPSSSTEDGVSVEILDLRTLIPWDREAVLESVERARRCSCSTRTRSTGGFGGEIAATIAEEAFEQLDAPVRRIAAPDSPVPFSRLAREGVHPAGRGRRRGAPRARRLLRTEERENVSTGTQVEVVMPQMGVSVSEGHDHQVAQAGGDSVARTSRCSRSRPTRSTPRCRAPARASSPRSASRRARRSRSGRARRDRARGRAPRARRACRPAAGGDRPPTSDAPPPRSAAEPVAARAAAAAGSRRAAPLRAAPAERERQDVRLTGRRADRRRARRRPERRPGHGQGGRVTKKDILAFIESGAAVPPPAAAEAPPPHRRHRRARGCTRRVS